jgi:hypothetical protein
MSPRIRRGQIWEHRLAVRQMRIDDVLGDGSYAVSYRRPRYGIEYVQDDADPVRCRRPTKVMNPTAWSPISYAHLARGDQFHKPITEYTLVYNPGVFATLAIYARQYWRKFQAEMKRISAERRRGHEDGND